MSEAVPSPTAMEGTQAPPVGRRLVRLWVGVLLPPLSWVTDFMSRYFAIRYANVHDRRWPMELSTALALVALLVGVRLCWTARRSARADEKTLAAWGLGLALFFFVLILGQAFPGLILSPREIA